jgi:peptidoglycan hydrolase-like protein with peptidoglycan-binding domain
MRSAFINDDNSTPSVKPQQQLSNQDNFNPTTTFVAPIATSPELDQQYLDHLYQFMAKQNITGPDYFEFADTLNEVYKELGNVAEASLFKTAYLGYKSQGITPDILITTAQKYIDLFNQHKKEFEAVLSQEAQKTVGLKQQENITLQSAVDGSQGEIAKLEQQIQKLKDDAIANSNKINENNQIIMEENTRLTTKKTKFDAAFKVVIDKINGDIAKIQNYIK